MKRTLGMILFAAVFICLGIASLTIAALAMGAGTDNPIVERVIVEAGGDIPGPQAFLADSARLRGMEAAYVTDMSIFNPRNPKLGEFTVEVAVIGSKTYSSKLLVTDSVPPTGTFVNRLSVKGEYIAPEEFVTDISDATAVTVAYDQPVDFELLGDQVIWVVLKDEGGNETRLCGYLYVLDGVRNVYAEFGYPPAAILTEHFLFNELERERAAFLTDVDALDFSVPGRIRLDMWVMEQSVPFYINIIDTTPPEAAPLPVTAYLGRPRPASDFVADIVDFSPVECLFAEEPDWDELGESEVFVTVTDAFGNSTELATSLSVVIDEDPPYFTGLSVKYVKTGGTVTLRKGVEAFDAADGAVTFTVDTSEVNLLAAGTYYAFYEAVDSEGNTARVASEVVVSDTDPEEVYALAGEALDRIIRDDMSMTEKAKAIYAWVRNNIHYTSTGDKTDVIVGAYNGLKKGSGDCFTYYALSIVMLDLAGIPNIGVERVGGKTMHYWCLVNLGDGWYHFDNCPYINQNAFYDGFLFTESQAQAFTAQRGRNYYDYDADTLPEGVEVVWK